MSGLQFLNVKSQVFPKEFSYCTKKLNLIFSSTTQQDLHQGFKYLHKLSVFLEKVSCLKLLFYALSYKVFQHTLGQVF
jgi:hypothetical protein